MFMFGSAHLDLHIRSKLREHISQRLLMKHDSGAFTDSESLFFSGRLDSVDAIEIISLLESEYGIDFAKIEFDITLLDTVDAIFAIVDE